MIGRWTGLTAGVLLMAGLPPAAQAQTRVPSRVEVLVTATTDAGGADPYCAMAYRLRNVGSSRLTVFAAEIAATDVRSGASLRMPTTTIPFSSVQPGEVKEWTTAGVHGARCDQVRLQVTRVTCSPRCESAAWTQQGLAALETPR